MSWCGYRYTCTSEQTCKMNRGLLYFFLEGNRGLLLDVWCTHIWEVQSIATWNLRSRALLGSHHQFFGRGANDLIRTLQGNAYDPSNRVLQWKEKPHRCIQWKYKLEIVQNHILLLLVLVMFIYNQRSKQNLFCSQPATSNTNRSNMLHLNKNSKKHQIIDTPLRPKLQFVLAFSDT